MDKVEKYLGEASGRKFDDLVKEGSTAKIWVNGKVKFSGKVTGKYGDGFRFKDGSTEIEIELK